MTTVRNVPTIGHRRYRWVDRATKLSGVLALAAGLHVGILSAPGIALAATGVLLATCTVPIETPESPDDTGPADAIEGEPA